MEKICKGIQYIIFGGNLKKGNILQFYNRRRLQQKINDARCDMLFAPASSELIACGIPRSKKLIYLSDAVYYLMLNYYWFNISEKEQSYGNACEQKALDRADAVIFASDWAKNGAIKYYYCDSNKIYVIPFGSNLKDKYQVRKIMGEKTHIHLLLVGVEWKRKGIDVAIDCIHLLNKWQKNFKFDLTIVGFVNPVDKNFVGDDIIFKGKLNKNNPDEYNEMIEIYQNSDIFILPTRAECAGIVFCEAAEYGLPVATYDTGGISTYVENEVNGIRLPMNAGATEFAHAVLNMIESGKMSLYVENARRKYEKELNWDAWRKAFDEILKDFIIKR